MKKHLLSFLMLFILTTLLCQAQTQPSSPTLWGMTPYGGTADDGVIFKTTASGIEKVIHDFGRGTDGILPEGSLIQASNGLLYGMTWSGGANYTSLYSGGIIFSYDTATNVYTDVHDFGSGTDGKQPIGSLLEANNGLLYGVTEYGGINNYGTIFSYNINSDSETDLYDFNAYSDGFHGRCSLIQAHNGLLYGLLSYGGDYNDGVIFSYNISTGIETKLHDFGSGTDGQFPIGSLIQANNGLIYGTTSQGGNAGYGTIFSYDISTGTETDLYDFGETINDGQIPDCSLMQANDQLLYGTTQSGGTYKGGVIFNYNTSTGNENILHEFGNGDDCRYSQGSLIQGSDSLLYGMSVYGGDVSGGQGTIFSYNINAGIETILYNFSGGSGYNPVGNLLEVYSTIIVINQPRTMADTVQVYPNPLSDFIHLNFTQQQQQTVQLSLYNTFGQKVWLADFGSTNSIKAIIPITNLPNGVYILKVNSGIIFQQHEVVVAR